MTALLSLGHGRLTENEINTLLRDAGVRVLVDVRRFPGSRRHPHVNRAALERRLPSMGVSYRWDQRLGGRRSGIDSELDAWWTVPAFRAYAAHLRSPEGMAAVADLVADAARRPTAMMCGETLWWRCHRRIIADVVSLVHQVRVRHLDPAGGVTEHHLAEGAVLLDDNAVCYPARPAD